MQALIIIEAHGKIPAWSRIMSSLGVPAKILATSGHLFRYPSSLYPLGIKISKGQAVDISRTVRPEIEARIVAALRARDEGSEIIIATDDDPEGDVIALDVMRLIVNLDPMLLDDCLRVRPNAITRSGIDAAIKAARRDGGGIDDLMSRAVAGRTRAMTDRWMGASLSRVAGTGCGRVRAGLLGTVYCWARSPDLLRGLPETGEITLQARSGAGGLPFTAQIPLAGGAQDILAGLAKRYRGRLIPGHVTPMRSAGAAIAPRFSKITPFNTGDALAYASRFYGVSPKQAMRGLQDAYMAGRISYPRTDNRTMSQATASTVVQITRVCGIKDASVDIAGAFPHAPGADGMTAHEGIFPTPRMTSDALEKFRVLVRKPVQKLDPTHPGSVEDLMVVLVARRAFEAMRPNEMAPGVFHPRAGSDLSPEEIRALDDLEWLRPAGMSAPWARHATTDIRIWPMASVILEGMMIEGIGRPSTWASHAEQAVSSGHFSIPSPGALPRPTPEGVRILKALPRGVWSPATCRMIEKAMADLAPGENPGADILNRMRNRIDVWFRSIDGDVRKVLVDMLKSESDGAPGAAAGSSAERRQEPVISGEEIDPDLAIYDDPGDLIEDFG